MLALAALAVVFFSWTAVAGNWSAKNVSDLIAAINAANAAGGNNTIILAPGKTFTLTAVDNTADGPNGLPVIAANNKLTIRGNGDTIARSKAAITPAFRLFDVASGASLTLDGLTLANGLVIGDTGMDANGGAILNAAGATLTVKCSILLNNQVVGGDGAGGLGGQGFGGAIRSEGIANLDGVVFRGNQATGGATTSAEGEFAGIGFGGAVSSGNDGNLTVKYCWFTGNKATGGFRHDPNPLYNVGGGGALDNWGAALITDSMFTDNQAIGAAAEPGVQGGFGIGGALSTGTPWALNPVCTIRRCTFSHNRAVGADATGGTGNVGGAGIGGALHTGFALMSSVTTIVHCTFNDNEAIGGTGGLGWGEGGVINQEQPLIPGNQSLLTIVNSTFTDNKAIGKGIGGPAAAGAILNNDWGTENGSGAILVISNSWFVGNAALASSGGDNINNTSIAMGGAVDTSGNAIIRNSTFLNNRAVGGAYSPAASAGYFTTSFGGGLSSRIGTLDIRDSRFVGNQVIGADANLGGPAGSAGGGGIVVYSGMTASIVNSLLYNNTAVGGAGSAGIPGGAGIGGGLAVGFYPSPANPFPFTGSTVTLTGTTISRNQAIGGSSGGTSMGGGYAVGWGILFGFPDTSTVTLTGGSVVTNNTPDDVFQF
jgi:hypothetical protein